MSHPFELTFENAIGTYNALWNLSGMLATDPKVGNPNNWILTFRDALRGMLARMVAVDQNYLRLHQFQSQAPSDGNPNEWILNCESHAAVVFFGMDSAIECFVFAMNAIGYLKSPHDFYDITDAKSLRQIGPKNILGGGPADKRNPKSGYQKVLPRVAAYWKANESLLSTIFEHHDVCKHRSALCTGGDSGGLRVRDDPKQPGTHMSSTVHTVESIAHSFQKFMDELLQIALEEAAATFGYTTTKKTVLP